MHTDFSLESQDQMKVAKKFKKEHTITSENVRKIFDYSLDTGELVWKKVSPRMVKHGRTVGSRSPTGYFCFLYKRYRYRLHRVVWMWHYGEWPKQHIDHINGNPSDNRIENLRDISQRENCCNMKKHRDGQLVGANKHIINGYIYYEAKIRVGSNRYNLGAYKTPEEAHSAYMKAKELHTIASPK